MIIIILLSLIIDNYLNYYLAYLPVFFSYLKPLLFITSIIVFIILEYKNKRKIQFLFATVFIYDLLFNKVHFLYSIIFVIIYKMIIYLNKRLSKSFLSFMTIFILSLIMFILTKYLFLIIMDTVNLSLLFLYNQIIKSFVLNVLYSIILYYFLGINRKKA